MADGFVDTLNKWCDEINKLIAEQKRFKELGYELHRECLDLHHRVRELEEFTNIIKAERQEIEDERRFQERD